MKPAATPKLAGPPPRPTRPRVRHPGFIYVEIALFTLLIAAGATVRLIHLGEIPYGLNLDEASIGYDAWAILTHGIDRNGYRYPVNLVSWGNGQNALYAYLSMPFIKALGLTELSIRLTQAIFGVASLFAMYTVARMLAGRTFALFALFALSISPWHIMMSRWALEANILPAIVLLAFACLLRSLKSPRWIIPALFLLALSLYAYGTTYLFVPLFTLGVLIYGIKRRLINIKLWSIGLAIMTVTAIPISLVMLINLTGLPAIETPLFSMPEYILPARFITQTAFFTPDFFDELQKNISIMLNIFISGNDRLRYSAIPEFGYFYQGGIFLSLLGISFMAYDLRKNRPSKAALTLTLLWLALGVLVSITLLPNINRANLIWHPMIICAAYGLYRLSTMALSSRGKNILSIVTRRTLPGITCTALIIYLTISFIAFTSVYFTDYSERRIYLYAPSYPDALQHIMRHTNENETIYLTLDELYIYPLFYVMPEPQTYLNTVHISKTKRERIIVESFDHYVFGFNENAMRQGNAFLADNDELHNFPLSHFSVVRFAYYSAVYRRPQPVNYESIIDGHFGPPATQSQFNIYRRGTTLAYTKDPCNAADTTAPFYIHITPANPDDLPRYRRGYNFDALSFDFSQHGSITDGKCLALASLPGYKINRIRTGQWIRGGDQIWQAEFPTGK